MHKKKPWTAVHWLKTKEAQASACGVKGKDALYDSSQNMEFVTCNNCIRSVKAKTKEKV